MKKDMSQRIARAVKLYFQADIALCALAVACLLAFVTLHHG